MRKLLLFLFCAHLFCAFVNANENATAHLLVEENRQWNTLNYYRGLIEVMFPEYKTEVIYLEGDTVINDVSYLKMYRSYYKNRKYSSYIGGMRQEGQKVYSIDLNDKESLLYDFGLQVGDKFIMGILEVTLSEIKEEDFDGTSRKVYSFESEDGTSEDGRWIEGIGSLSGLLTTDHWSMVGGIGLSLLSCKQDGEVLYQNESYEEDFVERPMSTFLLEDTKWIDGESCSLDDNDWTYYEYEFKGYTLIGGNVFWKLYCGNQFIGAMREDRDQNIYIRNIIDQEIRSLPEKDGKPNRTLYELKKDTTYHLYSFDNTKWDVGKTFEYLGLDGMKEVTVSALNYLTLEDGEKYKYVDDIIYSIGTKSGVLYNIYPVANCSRYALVEYSREGKVLYKEDPVSIKEVQNELVKVYVNTYGQCIFSLSQGAHYSSAQLFDMKGQLICTYPVEGKNELIVSGLPEGFYLYKLEEKDSGNDIYGKVAVFF